MRAIIIGAGRGRRLMPTTADTPKCYAEVRGRRLLDWSVRAFADKAQIVLSVHTNRLQRYQHRTQHPADHAEKVTAKNGHITRIHRGIKPHEAHGEYTSIAKFTSAGAAQLLEHYRRALKKYA